MMWAAVGVAFMAGFGYSCLALRNTHGGAVIDGACFALLAAAIMGVNY